MKYIRLFENQINYNEGVDFLFEEYPILATIGKKEHYIKYLETIFPESKVKNIVYHGSRNKFDIFDKSKIGLNYGKLSLGFNFIFGLDLAYNYGGNIKSVLVNIKNPIYVKNIDGYTITDVIDNNFQEYKKQLLNNSFDGILGISIKKEESVVIVKEQEQIHILGSNEDIQKFKNYIKKNKLENLKDFGSFVNEEWDFKTWITNISDGVKLVLSREKLIQLREHAQDMNDEQRLNFLNKIEMELLRWKSIRFLIGIPTTLIGFQILNLNLNNVSVHFVILVLLWFISHFMVTRNKSVKDKVKRIFLLVRECKIVPEEQIKRVYSENDPLGEEKWDD
jgi:hypothetical protein